jgi:hypothetical protein
MALDRAPQERDDAMSVKAVIEVGLILMSVWSAHLAGALYCKSLQDRSLRLPAIVRSLISLVAGIAALAA